MIVNKHPTVLASHEFFLHNFVNIILIVMSFFVFFVLTQSDELVTHRFYHGPDHINYFSAILNHRDDGSINNVNN